MKLQKNNNTTCILSKLMIFVLIFATLVSVFSNFQCFSCARLLLYFSIQIPDLLLFCFHLKLFLSVITSKKPSSVPENIFSIVYCNNFPKWTPWSKCILIHWSVGQSYFLYSLVFLYEFAIINAFIWNNNNNAITLFSHFNNSSSDFLTYTIILYIQMWQM